MSISPQAIAREDNAPGGPPEVGPVVSRPSVLLDRFRRLRYRVSPQLFLAELLQKRWMEPVIPSVTLIAILVVFSVALGGSFTSGANISDTLRSLGEIGLLTLGEAIVVISGGVDLSVGAILGLTNVLALMLIYLGGVPPAVALVLIILIGGVLGAANGLVVAYLKARPFLTTLVTLIVYGGVQQLLSEHYSVDLATGTTLDPTWSFLGAGTVAALPSGFVLLLIIAIAGHVILSRSRPGIHLTAVGASRRAARRAGISVEWALLRAYIASGLLAGLAGALYAARVNSSSGDVGQNMEITALTAVVLGGISLAGGRGTLLRALLGAAVVTFLGNGLLLANVPGSTFQALLAGVLLIAVGIDTKWAKNRDKAIQKIYVNPTFLTYDPIPSTTADGGTPFAQNDALANAEPIGLGLVEGPEDVILDREGNLFTGDRRGWIHKFSGKDFENHEVLARPGGFPLGMTFMADESIAVCVGGMGLYAVSPEGNVSKLTDQTNRTWYRLRDDSRLRLADDCDRVPDGRIFFSEATTRFEFHEWILDGLEGRPNGRVICYDPATGSTRTAVPSLVFPNGICSCHDGESILIAQTWLCRILRYWHSGKNKGRLEVFADNFPGYLDNINRAADGGYWLAINGMRSPAYDLAMRHPEFRRRMMKRVPPDEWLYPSMNHGCVVHLTSEGQATKTMWDPGGAAHATITSMREYEGYLYVGGLNNNRLGRVPLPEWTDTCQCGQEPCRSATEARGQADTGRALATTETVR